MLRTIFTVWKNYMGTGLLLIFFLAAWLYLFLKEKEKRKRVLLVYVPMVVVLLFFNPLFYRLFMALKQQDVYFRVLWLAPFSIVIAYATICVYRTLRENRQRVLFLGGVVFALIAGGRWVYSGPLFQRAENLYHMPDSVVHICDAIEVEGREVTAAFPLDMVLYVRQYSPVVCMPYGREILMRGWQYWAIQNELCDVMESSRPDAELLGKYAREQACVYIVLPEEKEIVGDLGEQGYELFVQTDGYVVYRDRYFEPGF